MKDLFRILGFFSISLLLLQACNSNYYQVHNPSRAKDKAPQERERTYSKKRVSAERGKIADYAQRYVGIKYKYASRSPSKGFDCSGFTYYVFKQFDVKLPPSSSGQAAMGKKIPVRKAQPGDLIFFSKNGRGKVSHVGLCVENDTRDGLVVVHSTSSRGVIVENISQSSYWEPKIKFARNVMD